MITPRFTCLVSAPDLASYREAILDRACEGTVGDIRWNEHAILFQGPTRMNVRFKKRNREKGL